MAMSKESRLIAAIVLACIFMVIEIIGGYIANSIAIFSDAAHLLTDIAGFAIALLATIAAKAPATKRLTFGFARAEVFGALASVLSLWIITAVLLYEAYIRAFKWYNGNAEKVDGFLMFVVACFGVVVNLCLGYVFHEEHGGGLHPGHSHEHHHHEYEPIPSEETNYQAVGDVELGSMKKANCSDHDHSHSHSNKSNCSGRDHGGHDHGGHDHGHEHNHGSQSKGSCGGGHDHAHSHNHGSSKNEECSSHKSDHGHDHGHGHGHDHNGSAVTESTSLLSGKKGNHKKSSSCGHAEEHGHDHNHHGHHGHGDVNIEAAYLHVITDLIQSIGVALAGLVMWMKPHLEIIDPICTFLFSIVALYSTIPLLYRVFMILFEGIPSQIDWETVMEKFAAIEGVENVHDLHIWSISSTSISLTCHIRAENPQKVLKEANAICKKLGINHTTIQVHDVRDSQFCYSDMCDLDGIENPNHKCVTHNSKK